MSKCIECTIPRVNPKVNCGLWVIMMCQCRFILGLKRCTILVSNVNKWEGCTCVGPGSIWETSVTFSQFCYKPTTALKICYFSHIFIGVSMLYNVVLVSAVQQSESTICIHISPYPLPLEPPLSHPSRLSESTELISLCYAAASH